MTAHDDFPPGPWTVLKFGNDWQVKAANGALICFQSNEAIARSIAAIPERERAMARMREAAQIGLEGLDNTCKCKPSSGCKDAERREKIRRALAS